jgi:PAS domain S-box-containing protein
VEDFLMARKPTYEELEQRVKQLEAEAVRYRQVEKNLQESEARFSTFMDNIPAVVYLKNESGQHVYGNKTLFDKFDFPQDKFMGSTTRDIFPPAVAEKIEAYDEIVKTEGVPVETDGWSDEWRGQTRWWKEIKFPIKLPSGDMLIGGIAFDITERKQTEEKLEETEQRLRSFMDYYPANIYIKDQDLRHIYANKYLLDSFGMTLQSFIGTTSHDYFPPDVAESKERLDRIVLEEDVVKLDEHQRVMEDGRKRWFNDLKFPIHFAAGKTLIGGISHDVTKIRESEEALKIALDEISALKNRLEQENIFLREEIKLEHQHESFIGKSHAVKHLLRQAEEVAKTESTVLILGETGTGKELLAHEIHNLSARKDRPMVNVNCVSLPLTLVEAELFGREKGAYTGALTKQVGRFEIADGATIFLDEIGELPVDLQVKLLRVLDEGQFERLGSPDTITVDVRIIAATNRNLKKAVEEGKFREDLFYRLNVYPIEISPLRERLEDIDLLVWAFVREFGDRMGKKVDKIPYNSIEALKRYDWPGNVRELRNVVERAMIVSRGSTLKIDKLRPNPVKSSQIEPLDELQRNHIVRALEMTGWRVSGKNGAAEMLKINPKTLESRMRKLGIDRKRQIS